MKKNDIGMWIVLIFLQGLFCIMFSFFAYNEDISVSVLCSDHKTPVAISKDGIDVTPMTVEQQKKLQDDFRMLLHYSRNSIQTSSSLLKTYSLWIAGTLLFSIILEVIILLRILRRDSRAAK